MLHGVARWLASFPPVRLLPFALAPNPLVLSSFAISQESSRASSRTSFAISQESSRTSSRTSFAISQESASTLVQLLKNLPNYNTRTIFHIHRRVRSSHGRAHPSVSRGRIGKRETVFQDQCRCQQRCSVCVHVRVRVCERSCVHYGWMQP